MPAGIQMVAIATSKSGTLVAVTDHPLSHKSAPASKQKNASIVNAGGPDHRRIDQKMVIHLLEEGRGETSEFANHG